MKLTPEEQQQILALLEEIDASLEGSHRISTCLAGRFVTVIIDVDWGGDRREPPILRATKDDELLLGMCRPVAKKPPHLVIVK